LTNKYSFFSR